MKNYKEKIKKGQKRQILTFFIVIFIFSFFLPAGKVGFFNLGKASASELSLGISPPTTEYSLNPGESKKGMVKIANDSLEEITFDLKIQDFIVQDQKGTPFILPPKTLSGRFSASSWISVKENSFTVLPKQKKEIDYTIAVPRSARPGGHYAALLFLPTSPALNNQSSFGGSASVQTQIGSLISISIAGAITEYSQITKFSANPFQEYGPIKLFAQIKNLGDLHIRPVGEMTVTDMLGRTIQQEKLKEVNIFPEASRDYEQTIGTKMMIGRFKAQLTATYGQNNNRVLSKALYFWVFPWQLTILIMLIIIALALGVMYWRKRRSQF